MTSADHSGSKESIVVRWGRVMDRLIDAGDERQLARATKYLGLKGECDNPESDQCFIDYILGTAWSTLGNIRRQRREDVWAWEDEESEKEVLHLRRAISGSQQHRLDKLRLRQAFTNLGNTFSRLGRPVEALRHWNEALELSPRFDMAAGNKGLGLTTYSRLMYDEGHRRLMLKYAHRSLTEGCAANPEERFRAFISKLKTQIESVFPREFLDKPYNMTDHSLGSTDEEVEYRRWCLDNRLFLNPLNDLGSYPIASKDVMTCPSVTAPIGEGPIYHGFYNQIKQEFVSARYLYYHGVTSTDSHFSDKGVLLYNTLDYPVYGLGVEQMKLAYRSAYSILDKIAFFLNHYLRLHLADHQVKFRTFWYEPKRGSNELRSEFLSLANLPLRGLFWLSKDLFEDEPGFRNALEPDARNLRAIRNHLEHKYLKLHAIKPYKEECIDSCALRSMVDTLAHSETLGSFQDMVLKMLGMVREALIYLSLGVHQEEVRRRKENSSGPTLPGLPLDPYDDDWKTPDSF